MKELDERRKSALSIQLLKLFMQEINEGRFVEIHKLYETAHITNMMLLEQLNRHTAPVTDFYNSIYADISYLIISEIMRNPEVEELFVNLYTARYPGALKQYNSISSLKSKQNMQEAYRKAVARYIPRKDPALINKPEFILFCYLTYGDDKAISLGVIDPFKVGCHSAAASGSIVAKSLTPLINFAILQPRAGINKNLGN